EAHRPGPRGHGGVSRLELAAGFDSCPGSGWTRYLAGGRHVRSVRVRDHLDQPIRNRVGPDRTLARGFDGARPGLDWLDGCRAAAWQVPEPSAWPATDPAGGPARPGPGGPGREPGGHPRDLPAGAGRHSKNGQVRHPRAGLDRRRPGSRGSRTPGRRRNRGALGSSLPAGPLALLHMIVFRMPTCDSDITPTAWPTIA